MESHASWIYVIKQLELALRPRLGEVCARAGLSAAQYTALTVLERRPGITSSELARRSFVRAQTMAATLDPLLDAGLVRRERDADHARRMSVFLTSEGAEVIAGIAPEVARIEELLLDDLSAREREQFIELLHRARKSIAAAGRSNSHSRTDAA